MKSNFRLAYFLPINRYSERKATKTLRSIVITLFRAMTRIMSFDGNFDTLSNKIYYVPLHFVKTIFAVLGIEVLT